MSLWKGEIVFRENWEEAFPENREEVADKSNQKLFGSNIVLRKALEFAVDELCAIDEFRYWSHEQLTNYFLRWAEDFEGMRHD